MSFDLFPNEQLQTLERAAKNPSLEPQPGIWHNFLSGTGTTAMMGAAQVARAVDIAGAVGPIIMDKLSGGTTEQDKYFQEHDAVFNRAVDYWTPGPGEVGAAGKAVGSLLSIIPQFVISPGLAVATTGLSTAEDLTRQGIDVDKAIKAGMVQGTGLGLGMWLPIFGKSWATKALAAGAAGNIAQGIATTMATRQVLKGTPAEAQFNPWDMESIVINGLMGLAFGTIAHITTPEGKVAAAAERSKLTPADKDAIVAANAAMHVEHTTAPGRPVDDGSMTAHATAINKAIDDLLNGKTPDVEEVLGPAAVREAPQGDHLAGAGNPIADLTTVPRAFQPRAIGDAVRARLRETGIDAEEAQANGAIWESFFRTAGERYGVAPADLLQQYGVDIKRMTTGDQLLGALNQARKPGDTLFQSAEPFYSELAKKIEEAKLPQAPAKGWKDYVKGLVQKGVKPDEIEATGINEWLDMQEGRVTKAQVQEYLKANGVQVREVMLGGEGAPRTFDELKTLPDVAPDYKALQDLGFEPQLNPEDPSVLAFHDKETGDILASDDLTSYAASAENPNERDTFTRAARAAANLEYWWRSTPKNSEPKFSTWQLPGGENYRELLLTLPGKAAPTFNSWAKAQGMDVDRLSTHVALRGEYNDAMARYHIEYPGGPTTGQFTESHYPEPNVLAHVRFNERTDADGKRVLFVEEFQSDWAQKGRERGFKGGTPQQRAEQKAVADVLKDDYGVVVDGDTSITKLEEARVPPEIVTRWFDAYMRGNTSTIPVAPFVSSQKFGVFKENTELAFEKGELADPGKGNPQRFETREKAEAFAKKYSAEVRDLGHQPDTPGWVGLSMRRMIRYAAEHGFDRIAWTRGEQQVDRYTSALRSKVDYIEWEKTDKGVQLVGFKGKRYINEPPGGIEPLLEQQGAAIDRAPRGAPAPWRLTFRDRSEAYYDSRADAENVIIREWNADRGADFKNDKVVDTTEREDALSDAIGKAMADQIRQSTDQKGTIEGDNLKIDSTGMANFYDRIVPNIANKIIAKLGGERVGETSITTGGKIGEPPAFREMTRSESMGFEGAEPFPDGGKPRTTDVELMVNGEKRGALVIVDQGGMHLVIDDDNFTEVAIPKELISADRDWQTAEGAIDAVSRKWGSAMWDNTVELMSGDSIKITPVLVETTTPQHSFDITPAMREKALAGLPLFQEGARGQIQFGDGQTVIGLFESANKSTFLHESGHFFLQVTRDLATKPGAPEGAMQDWSTLADWLKIEGGEIPREAHEQFARGFEAYVAEGRAPNEALRTVFQQFRDWLLRVYENIANLGPELTDPVRRVMDRMLESQREDPAPRAAAAEDDAPPWARFDDDPRKEIDQQQVQASLHAQAAEVVQEQIAVEAPTPRLLVPPIPEDHQLPPALALRLQDQEVRTELAYMAKDAGWATIGWRLQDRSKIGTPSFTAWIPNAEWWLRRPDRMSEGKVKEAVRKALAGEKLKPAEERTVDFMLGEIEQMMGPPLQTGEQAPRAREDVTLQNRADEAPFTPEDYAAAGIDRLRGSDAELAIRLADEMHGEVGGDWSKMTPEQKDAELDALFGPAKTTSGSGAGGARAGSSARPPEGTAGQGEPPAASAAREIAARAPREASLEPIEPLPPKARKPKKAAKDGEPAADSEKPQVGPKKSPLGDTAAAAPDPIFETAARYLEGNPDLALKLDQPDGSTKTVKLKDELERTREAVARANEDAKLFAVAAECLIGAT